MKLTNLQASAVVAVVAACFSVGACTSSTSSNPTTGDGGSGSGGSGSGSGSGGGTTATPAEYCSALTAYVKQCNLTDACDLAQEQDCTTYASALSAQSLGATVTCAAGASCGDAGSSAVGTCIEGKEATFTPTTAQAAVATGFCAQCASAYGETAAECQTAFFSSTATVSSDSGTDGLSPNEFGSIVLELNDSFSASLTTTCIPSLTADSGTACISTFGTCAEAQLQKVYTTPTACQTSSTGTGSGSSFPIHFSH
jgi:hypothetical protein